tara:strand:+ start:326 stop:727 length:402 start_codon:yes stop_codon:yes gene_type:complete
LKKYELVDALTEDDRKVTIKLTHNAKEFVYTLEARRTNHNDDVIDVDEPNTLREGRLECLKEWSKDWLTYDQGNFAYNSHFKTINNGAFFFINLLKANLQPDNPVSSVSCEGGDGTYMCDVPGYAHNASVSFQ